MILNAATLPQLDTFLNAPAAAGYRARLFIQYLNEPDEVQAVDFQDLDDARRFADRLDARTTNHDLHYREHDGEHWRHCSSSHSFSWWPTTPERIAES